ncbi:MAG: TonB-dependent receptor plug domain-containing protein, partial [Rhodothermales bacterium]
TWQGLGLHVETRYVQSADSALRDVLFLVYRIENRGRIDLRSVSVGMWGDPHIGGARNYQDDLARFVPTLGLLEVWDADGVADTPGLAPGYFGYQFLEGVTGLTSLTATPFNDVNVANDEQLWGLVRPGRFDRMPARPGDDVYIFGTGPARLPVGESMRFSVALLLADNAADLRAEAAKAREIFERDCPPGPPSPYQIHQIDPRESAARYTPVEWPTEPDSVLCPLSSGCEHPFAEPESCAWMGGPDLDPYVTTPSRIHEPLMDAPASVSVIEGDEFVRDPAPSIAATLRHTVGVDIAQIGSDRYQVATRGFNQSFAGNTELLVDNRQAAVPGLGFNSFALLPVTPIDVAQAEVVRGSLSSLYGSRADHGAIQFLTKEPFDYPGTSFSGSFGENQLVQGALRHAALLSDRFAYKIVGSYSQAKDQLFAHPAEDGILQGVESRDDHVSNGFARGTLQYRDVACACLTVTANVDYAGMKQNLLHDTGEMFADYRMGAGQLKVESDALFAQLYYMKGDTKDAHDYRT